MDNSSGSFLKFLKSQILKKRETRHQRIGKEKIKAYSQATGEQEWDRIFRRQLSYVSQSLQKTTKTMALLHPKGETEGFQAVKRYLSLWTLLQGDIREVN